jgi:hypothetical protein
MTSIFPQCFDCSEFEGVVQGEAGRTYRCRAFPDGEGIPREILFNEVSHARSYPGDHGIRFTPLDAA